MDDGCLLRYLNSANWHFLYDTNMNIFIIWFIVDVIPKQGNFCQACPKAWSLSNKIEIVLFVKIAYFMNRTEPSILNNGKKWELWDSLSQHKRTIKGFFPSYCYNSQNLNRTELTSTSVRHGKAERANFWKVRLFEIKTLLVFFTLMLRLSKTPCKNC